MLSEILTILSFASLVFILVIDMMLVHQDRPIYMTNQGHVNLYIVPFLISFILFLLAMEETTLGVIMLIAFTAVYIYILSYDKIILVGADMDEVKKELEQYLEQSGRSYKMRQTIGPTVAVEVNNYPNALTIRDTDRWIEIDNRLNYDKDFIEALNDHFRARVKDMKSARRRPNIYFYILLAVIIFLVTVLIIGNI